MAILRAIPKSMFSSAYEVYSGPELLCTVDVGWFREAGSFLLGSRCYEIRREPMWGAFVLTRGEVEFCRAKKPSALSRLFSVAYDGGVYELAAASPFQRKFVLRQAGQIIGTLAPVSVFSRKVDVELPEDLSRPVQVFLVWLVTTMWRRQSNS